MTDQERANLKRYIACVDRIGRAFIQLKRDFQYLKEVQENFRKAVKKEEEISPENIIGKEGAV